MAKINSNKHFFMAFLLGAAILACNFPGSLGSMFQTTDQTPVPAAVSSPASTLAPPNTPTWSAYKYTCEVTAGGSTMTTHLAWNDRSNAEDGYRVYRDQQVIATLPPNSTSYVDVAFVAAGKKLSYSIEAFNKDWQVSGNTITFGCQ